jgi:hypothetical protein
LRAITAFSAGAVVVFLVSAEAVPAQALAPPAWHFLSSSGEQVTAEPVAPVVLAAVQQAGLGLQQAGEGVQVCADTCATPTALKNKNKTSAFFIIKILLMVSKNLLPQR